MLHKVNIFWQTLLVTLALLGLVTVQGFWISHAISLRQAEFDEQVAKALIALAGKVETLVLSDEQQSTNKILKKLEKTTVVSRGAIGGSTRKITETEEEFIASHPFPDGVNWSDSDAHQLLQVAQAIVQDFSDEEGASDPLKGFTKAGDFLQATPQPSVEEIDSLLKDALHKNGIATSYHFALLSEHGDPIEYKDSISRGLTTELLTMGYIYRLYRSNPFDPPVSISVFFPDKNQFVWSSLFWMMLLSILFISVLIYVFYSSMKGLLRERYLAAMKNDFINNMTHELKTPISTISLAGEFLTDDQVQSSGEARSRYIGMIKEENQRLGKLVEKVLQSAIIDKGELKLKKEKVNLHDIVHQAAKSLEIQIQKRGGQLILNLQSTQPELEADAVHLTNMVYNLLDNAIKYTPEAPRIEISTVSTPDKIILSVSDNGVGISKEDQKKIFDKLYRVPTGNLHNVKGFGLGLSYVKAIVEQHGGQVNVKSILGKGSTFEAHLPYKTTFVHG